MVEKHVWIVLKENMVMDKVFIDTNIMIESCSDVRSS